MRLFWLASATTWPGDIGTTSSWPSLIKSNDVRRSKGMIRDEQDGIRSLLLCSSLASFVSNKRAERVPYGIDPRLYRIRHWLLLFSHQGLNVLLSVDGS
jgi:hypothetical protein